MLNDLTSFDAKLTPEAEAGLWEEFWRDSENDNIRVRLVELYLPLIVKVASTMPSNIKQHMTTEELMSSGVVGLHAAISSFRPDSGATFSTYANKRIRGAILDDLRNQDHLTRTQRTSYKTICAKINELTLQLGRPPEDTELAQATGLSVNELDRLIGMGSEMVNLNDEFGDGLRYMDVLSDQNAPTPFDIADNALALDKLREFFKMLPDREQKILYLRHFEDLGVREIAAVMEVSEGRISQLYQKAVLKLRAMMKV